jgi:large subunit ribosomal protein L35
VIRRSGGEVNHRSRSNSAGRVNERDQEYIAMPKMKTHSGAKKRVRVTGSGKLLRERTGRRHKLEEKSSRRTRRLAGTIEVSPTHAKKFKKLLGI